MKLLELIAECVRFVSPQTEDDINDLTITNFQNSSNYRSFIVNALPEINRAIQEITPFKKFQLKEYDLEIKSYNPTDIFFDIDLPTDIKKEIYEIYKIEFINENGYITLLEYRKFKDKYRVVNPKRKGTINVRYYPRIRLLTDADKGENYVAGETLSEDKSLDLETLGIDDYMCISVIPYLVKAKLWQEIEPSIAQLSKTEGLQNLSILNDGDNNEPYQSYVFEQYGLGE